MAISNEEAVLIGLEVAKAIQKSGGFGKSVDPRIISSEEKNKTQQTRTLIETAKAIAEDLANIKNTTSNSKQNKSNFFEKGLFNVIGEKLDPLNKMPSYLVKALSSSGSSFAKSIANGIKTEGDVTTAQTKIGNLQGVRGFLALLANGQSTVTKTMDSIEELGYNSIEAKQFLQNFVALGIDGNGNLKTSGKLARKALHEFDSEVYKAGKTMDEFASKAESTSKLRNAIVKGMRTFSVALARTRTSLTPIALMATMYSSAARSAAKFGVQVDIFGANMRGMQMEEWAGILNSSRSAILAMTGGVTKFKSIVGGSAAEGLVAFTGSLPEANKGLAAMVVNSRMLGDSTIDTSKFVKGQTSIYKKLHKTLGMTMESFTGMNTVLHQDSDIREILLRLGQRERTQYFKQMQQDTAYYMTQGLLKEQALALVKAMKRAAGVNLDVRMKQGASLAALMGAIGMGNQATRARQLEMLGGRRQKGQSVEFAKILEAVALNVARKKQQGYGTELAVEKMVQTADLSGLLNSVKDLALAAGAKAKKGNLAEMQNRSVVAGVSDKVTGTVLTKLDQASAWLRGPYFQAVLGIKGAVESSADIAVGMASVFGVISTGFVALLALPAVVLALGAIAIAGFAATIYSLFTGKDNIIDEMLKGIGHWLGSEIYKIVQYLKPDFMKSDAELKMEANLKNVKTPEEQTKAKNDNTQTSILNELKTLNGHASLSNVLSHKGNKNSGEAVIQAAKGNTLKEKQQENENVRLRSYSIHSAFPNLANPA